jgi:hypothetical protein
MSLSLEERKQIWIECYLRWSKMDNTHPYYLRLRESAWADYLAARIAYLGA